MKRHAERLGAPAQRLLELRLVEQVALRPAVRPRLGRRVDPEELAAVGGEEMHPGTLDGPALELGADSDLLPDAHDLGIEVRRARLVIHVELALEAARRDRPRRASRHAAATPDRPEPDDRDVAAVSSCIAIPGVAAQPASSPRSSGTRNSTGGGGPQA